MNCGRVLFSFNSKRFHSTYTIGLVAGDGIGREVVPASRHILEALNSTGKYQFKSYDAGFEYFLKHGTALPESTVQGLSHETDGAIFGAVSSPSHKVAGYSSPIVALRKRLDLYANVRPIRTPDGKIDMLIFRENTECLYIKKEKETTDEQGRRISIAERRITEYASRRIGRRALEAAFLRDRPVKKLTVVHKANVLSVTDGLFRESVLDEWSRDERFKSSVKLEEQLVDSMVYRLFREPAAFDVIVAPNLYGDIISDGAAALVGSLGLVPGANVGDTYVMGEPVHGSAPDIVGKGIANPIACIRSAALLLEHFQELDDAQRIHNAVDQVLIEGEIKTPDLGGKSTTRDVVNAILQRL